MYIQITTRCNMTCDHCCYSCTKQGQDMNEETFKQALEFYSTANDYMGLAIGGGEPTLHKRFMPWLFEAICAATMSEEELPVFVATNGTNTKVALKLAGLARKGLIMGALSLTQWHREQSVQPTQEVIDAFRRGTSHVMSDADDCREIRGERHYEPYAVGRAKEWGAEGCCCDTMVIDPAGIIWECGCKLKSMGSIWAPIIPEEYFNREEKCTKLTEEG